MFLRVRVIFEVIVAGEPAASCLARGDLPRPARSLSRRQVGKKVIYLKRPKQNAISSETQNGRFR